MPARADSSSVRGGTYAVLRAGRLAARRRSGRQRLAVHLAVRRQRQPVESDEDRRHHVLGQGRREVAAQRRGARTSSPRGTT